MKIIEQHPEIKYDRMYCPSTDEVIFAPDYEEINEDADAFIAYWHGDVLEEPSITDEKLEAAWKKYFNKWSVANDAYKDYINGLQQDEIIFEEMEKVRNKIFHRWNGAADDEYIDIWKLVEQFLMEYDNPNWIVYECTFSGMACGPVSTTVYYVVKSDTIIEDDPDINDD
jgi:hypothetical protein